MKAPSDDQPWKVATAQNIATKYGDNPLKLALSSAGVSGLFDDDAASDTSTVVDDGAWVVGHPSYDLVHDVEPKVGLARGSADQDKHYIGNVLDDAWDADRSSAQRLPTVDPPSATLVPPPEFTQYLQSKNMVLEQENAMLRMKYEMVLGMSVQNNLQMQAQQALIGHPQPPMAQMQAQQALTRQARPQMCKSPYPSPQDKIASGFSANTTPPVALKLARDCNQDGANTSSTTVMVRSLPNTYSREMLLQLLDARGFEGKYDFFYLPIDFKTNASLGYAFINFVSTPDANCFFEHFHGFSAWALPTQKVAAVKWSRIQGLSANIERYRSSPVMHTAVPDNFKPVLLVCGERVPFPAPTSKVFYPQCRKHAKGPEPRRDAV